MAARTSVTMGVTWGASLCVYDAAEDIEVVHGPPPGPTGLTGCGKLVSISALGAGATLVDRGAISYGPAQSEAPEKPEGYGDTVWWGGYYLTYRLTVSAPGVGNTQTKDYGVWIGDEWVLYPDSGVECVVGDLKVPVAFSVSGLYLKAAVTDATYSDRQSPMDYTDRTGQLSWWADEYTQVTVSGGGLSVSGTMTGAQIGEVEIGSNFNCHGSLSCNRMPTAGKDYVGMEGLSWAGDAVPADQCSLHKPGLGDAPWPEAETSEDFLPDPPADGDCTYVHGAADGSLYLQRLGDNTNTVYPYTFQVQMPYLLTMVPVDAKMMVGGGDYSITYTGDLKYWEDHVAKYKTWTDELAWDEWQATWQTAEQRSRYFTHSLYADEDDDWRTDQGENVGGANANNNDERCALYMHSIAVSSMDAEPWWADFTPIEVSHIASLDVNDPEGATSRPSLWTAGTGVTVDAGDNDSWTVAAGTASPTVSRTYQTRYWLRLDRLADHADDAANEHNPDWPLMLYPNLAIATTEDDPDWWSSPNPTYEDEWHWSEFGFLEAQITAARAGTVTLTIHYSTVVVSDPGYTCFEHRFGAEGEWEYTRTQRTATYSIPVSAGANTVTVDLCRDANGVDVQGATCLMHVDSLELTLPGNSGGSPDAWHLDGLSLVPDPEATQHAKYGRFWRQWDWLGTRWVGYDTLFDGVPALQVAPLHGYGSYPHSRGIMYIHKRQHCPDTELTDRLDYAEEMGRIATVIGWCRGWVATYTSPAGSEHNQDADQGQVSAVFYPWDLEHTTTSPHRCAIAVGHITPPAGVRFKCYHTVFPRGQLTGLLYNSSGVRVRNASGAVRIYDEATGLLGAQDTNESGQWFSDYLLEAGHTYAVGELTGLTVGNREFHLAAATATSHKQPHNAEGYVTDKYVAFADDGNGRIYLQRSPSARMGWLAPVYITDGTYPWIDVKPQGDLILCKQSGAGSIVWMQSRDAGYTWAGVGTPVDGAYPVATEYNGIQYLVSYASGAGQIIRRSQNYFSTLLTYASGVTSALVTSTTDAERAAFLRAESDANALCVIVPYSGALSVYRSVNDGETWTT